MTTLEGVGRATGGKRAPAMCALAIAAATVLLLLGKNTVVGAWPASNAVWVTLVLTLDVLTAALLLDQYRSGAGPRTLVFSWAYLASAGLMVLSGLAIPTTWTVRGLWGGDMNGVWWLWTARHLAFLLLVGGALAPWPTQVQSWLSRPDHRNRRAAASSAVVAALVAGLGVLCADDTHLPRIYELVHVGNGMQLLPGVQALLALAAAAALLLAAYGMHRRGVEQGIEVWAIVALVAMIGDVVIVLAHFTPNSVSFYGGRVLAVLSTAVTLGFILRQVNHMHRDTADSAHRLEDENAALIEAQRLREHLTAIVSHDMRTPLAGLQGYLELLLEDEDLEAPLERRMHERSWMLTRRLTLLTEDLLAAANLENGDLVVAPARLDLRAQFVECTQVFPDLDLRVVCPRGITAEADPLRLQQILANLVRNAQKHGAEPVTISAVDAPGAVTITVADSGPGVPPDFVPRLFDRYTQLGQASGGSGLGLSVTRDLVVAHGGSIAYDGAANGFVFSLPHRVLPALDASADTDDDQLLAGEIEPTPA